MPALAKKPYYECHITIDTVTPGRELALKIAIQMAKWKFSKIDGDPIVGEGVRCYATRHFSTRWDLYQVREVVNKMADKLEIQGFNITRRKIEMVLHDRIMR